MNLCNKNNMLNEILGGGIAKHKSASTLTLSDVEHFDRFGSGCFLIPARTGRVVLNLTINKRSI